VEKYKKDLTGFDISKGTIRFQPAKPIPAAVVRKLMKARIAAPPKKNRSLRTRAKPRA
jgi:uncharacterized protein YdhG (YjbR/CyaY superfamily)